MNHKNDEITKNLTDKSLNEPKKALNPIKKVVITVSTAMSISMLFTACSSLLNYTYNNGNPTKIELSGDVKEKEYKKYDIYTVNNSLNTIGSNLKIKLEKYEINIYNYKNLTPEDYKKIKHGLSNQELIALYHTLGDNIDEVEKVVISMGYRDINDYFDKEGYINEYDWMDQMYQNIYDSAVGQTPPSEKAE